ncbi:class I SAM-dependent methyltransferase [Maridesulfovibrio sp. FT414]|uniref:class I SAM-dependent methyltransferase n=1 Tax=Maridesulfovibrio sp. FT414 TaxID=2979469 RepID=UPI003D8083AD
MSDRKCWTEHSGQVLHSKDGFDVIDCECCGFKHIIPLPSEEELREIYKHDYHVKDKPLMLEHQLEDREWLDATNNARLEKLEEFLGRKGRILDVGAGNGFFLQRAADRGWEAKGVEPSDKAAEYAGSQGLDVDCAVFDRSSAASLGLFDVIHLGDVMEHLPDPAGMLELCRDTLAPGGLIAVGVPNEYTPVQKILNRDMKVRPWWVAPPHHLNYFDRESLENLLTRTGFSPMHAEVSFPMELFLLMGRNYLDNPELGRECHAMRKELEMSLTRTGNRKFLDKLYTCFAEAGMGRTVLMVARKEG